MWERWRWSLGRLLGASTSSAVFLRFNPLPYRLGLDRTLIRPLLSFGLPLAAASMVAFVAGFLDQLLVGHLLGAVFLGYYVLAFNLASWPVTIFSAPLRMVAPAMFSRRQGDPDRLARDFKRVLRPLAVVALPVCVMLSVASTQVVEIVYGEQWLPAAPIFRWMAIFAAVRIFFELCYDFLVVLGRTKSILLIQVLWIPVLCGCLVVGIRAGGPVGAALSVLVSAIVPLSIYLVELRRAGVAALVLLRTLIPSAVVTGLVAGTTVWLVSAMGSPWLICLSAGSTLTVLLVGALWRLRGDLAVFGAGQDSATGPRGATSLRVGGGDVVSVLWSSRKQVPQSELGRATGRSKERSDRGAGLGMTAEHPRRFSEQRECEVAASRAPFRCGACRGAPG